MKIIALVKQVPDSTEIRVDKVTGTLIRAGVPSIINPDDLAGVEEALKIKETKDDVTVTVISMGPPQASGMLKELLARGVDEVVLITDRAFAGADTCATSSTCLLYTSHAMNKDTWEKAKALGVLSYLDDLKETGKIRNLGFSFHDEYAVFEEMINARDWDFCQIQYNYIDRDVQAGDQGYALCAEKQIPMVVMEPVKGGNLAVLPEDIASILKNKRKEDSISAWALRWVGSHDNVRVILSGMSTMEPVSYTHLDYKGIGLNSPTHYGDAS